jgi:chromosome segregation ATPase
MIAELRNVFSRVRSKAREAEATAFEIYWAMVRRIAKGERLDDAAIVDATIAAGRNVDQLERDIELFNRRERLAAELAEAPSQQREAARLEQQIATKSQELAQLRAKLETEIGQLYERKKSLDDAVASTAQHATELSNSCPNPALAERETELQQQRRELLGKRQPLAETLRDSGPGTIGSAVAAAREQLEQFEERAAAGQGDARQHCEQLRSYLKGCEERMKQSETLLAEIDRELATVDRELAQIRAAKMKP